MGYDREVDQGKAEEERALALGRMDKHIAIGRNDLTIPTGPDPDAIGTMALTNPTALRAQLEGYTAARKLFVEWLFAALTPGTDYMLIHRKIGRKPNQTYCPNAKDRTGRSCDRCGAKACLCKPGSEKICGLLRLRPTFRRDLETWEMLGSPVGVVSLVCELRNSDEKIVAEGRGVRDQRMDYEDANKTIKMVQKSAQTDAVLRCAGLSEVFTLDLETTRADEAGNGREEIAMPRRKGADDVGRAAVDAGGGPVLPRPGDAGSVRPVSRGSGADGGGRGVPLADEAAEQAGFFDTDPAAACREAEAAQPPPAPDHTGLIGPDDIAHLMAQCRKHDVSEDTLKAYLLNRLGITSRKKISRVLFPAIIQWVQRQDNDGPPEPKPAAKIVRRRR